MHQYTQSPKLATPHAWYFRLQSIVICMRCDCYIYTIVKSRLCWEIISVDWVWFITINVQVQMYLRSPNFTIPHFRHLLLQKYDTNVNTKHHRYFGSPGSYPSHTSIKKYYKLYFSHKTVSNIFAFHKLYRLEIHCVNCDMHTVIHVINACFRSCYAALSINILSLEIHVALKWTWLNSAPNNNNTSAQITLRYGSFC